MAFRLELQDAGDGYERIVWNGIVDGEPVSLVKEPYTSAWQRFVVGLLSLIPADSQL